MVAEHLVAAGLWDCRIGIADGIFAAEQAARQRPRRTAAWSRPAARQHSWPGCRSRCWATPDLAILLRRLGIRSLGDFAALAPRDVLTRFGVRGAGLHRLARGEDARPAVSRRPPLEMGQRVAFEPGLETIEPIVFSTRQTADRLVAELSRHGLVATQVRVEVTTDGGLELGSRVWAHPRWFTASDVIDRLYWQLQGDPAPEPVTAVRLVPDAVESLADHGEGLWGGTRDDQVERGIARLQGMLGPEDVLAPAVQGGRNPRDRQSLTPWGERRGEGATHDFPGRGASHPPPRPGCSPSRDQPRCWMPTGGRCWSTAVACSVRPP